MKKIFVSVPFAGKSNDEIRRSIQVCAKNYILKNYAGKKNPLRSGDLKFVDNCNLTDEEIAAANLVKNPKVYFLGLALQKMADCDDVIFSEDWENANGCKIEHMAHDLYMKNES